MESSDGGGEAGEDHGAHGGDAEELHEGERQAVRGDRVVPGKDERVLDRDGFLRRGREGPDRGRTESDVQVARRENLHVHPVPGGQHRVFGRARSRSVGLRSEIDGPREQSLGNGKAGPGAHEPAFPADESPTATAHEYLLPRDAQSLLAKVLRKRPGKGKSATVPSADSDELRGGAAGVPLPAV